MTLEELLGSNTNSLSLPPLLSSCELFRSMMRDGLVGCCACARVYVCVRTRACWRGRVVPFADQRRTSSKAARPSRLPVAGCRPSRPDPRPPRHPPSAPGPRRPASEKRALLPNMDFGEERPSQKHRTPVPTYTYCCCGCAAAAITPSAAQRCRTHHSGDPATVQGPFVPLVDAVLATPLAYHDFELALEAQCRAPALKPRDHELHVPRHRARRLGAARELAVVLSKSVVDVSVAPM